MAFTEFYCQTTGSNLNAGSTTADAAVYTSPANGGWDSTTGVFTPTSGDPSASVSVGDFASVYLDAATVTGFVGRVTAVSTTTITVSLTAKSGTIPTTSATGLTCKTGGAWKGPNAAENFPFNFITVSLTNSSTNPPRVNLKAGTYSVTANVTHANQFLTFQGYTTTVGDGGRWTLDGGTTNAVLFTLSAANCVLADMVVQNNATGGVNGLDVTAAENIIYRLAVHDVRSHGIQLASGATGTLLVECEAYACNLSASAAVAGIKITSASSCSVIRCISHDNSGTGSSGFIFSAAYVNCDECIADTNGEFGFMVAAASGPTTIISNCDSYNNTSDGLKVDATNAGTTYVENCNFVKNGGYGINLDETTTNPAVIVKCGFGAGTQANTSGQINSIASHPVLQIGTVTYANDVTPWTDPADGDFRVSLAAAKGAGRGSFLQTQTGYGDPNATVAYPDIGAGQHQDAGSGGGGRGGTIIGS